MELILCRVVVSCSPTRNIVPHTSLHDQPCHKTMKKCEDFEGMVISLLTPRKFAIRTCFCNCPQYLCLFGIVFECSPAQIYMIQERCWFSQIDFFIKYFPHRIKIFFFPANSCHPHTQIRIIFFHDVQRDIPIWNLLPSMLQ